MFSKTNKTKRSFIGAIAMSLVFLMGSALGVLIETNLGQITKPTTGVWTDYATTVSPIGDFFFISKPEQLAYLAKNPSIISSKKIQLTADIDLAGHEWVPINVSGVSSNFVEFDGMGHTISNVKISDGTKDNVGLFGSCTNIKISNFKLSNVDIKGKSNVGAVIGNGGMITNIDKVEVKSGKVVATGGNVAGIAYSAMGSVTNSINNADVISYGANAAGIVGATCLTITNCINTGDVTGTTNVAGIIANSSISRVTKCYVDCTITGQSDIGGIGGSVAMESTFQDCGFYGKIVSTNSSPENIGAILAKSNVKNYGTSPMKIYNCYAVADIFLSTDADSSVHKFGVPTEQTEFKSSYSYSAVTTPGQNYEYRKYKVGASETEPFSEFAYNSNINGGYPFPRSLFAVGQFIECDTLSYLQSFEYNDFTVTIENDGTHYYVKLGLYPQEYVGYVFNPTLEAAYNNYKTGNDNKTLQRVGGYTVDTGISGTVVYEAYKYTDGNTYVRVPSAIVYGSNYEMNSHVNAQTGETYWFSVTPIKWWVLNYTDVQNGAKPIVVSENALTANVSWNKSINDGNLWSNTCNVRTWLNNKFYNEAFKGGYKEFIDITTVQNNTQSNANDGTGTSTKDRVWLLSYNEVNGKYFSVVSDRYCTPTNFALVNNCLMTKVLVDGVYRQNCVYYLRTALPNYSNDIRTVNDQGAISNAMVNNFVRAVRPALTLNI